MLKTLTLCKSSQPDKSAQSPNGFSLIELIIVILILSIISMIAIPNLLAARRSANESAAIGNTRTLVSAQATFKVSSLSRDFGTIAQLQSNGLIDSTFGLAPMTKNGYYFELDIYPTSTLAQARFNLRTRPLAHSLTRPLLGTGSRDFGVNENGAIFQTSDDTPVTFDLTTRVALGSAVPAGNN